MEIGQTLSQRYTLIARLGKGAMGIVYRALDTQTGQEVAVKVIARELALDHDMLERFRREGEALRQLKHPNIVGFVNMLEYEDQHVIVMEFVPGGSLHTLIRQGPLPSDRARRIALELSDALTRAHHLSIIHRDLKPENVLLAEDSTPKLTDFGVARLISEGTRLTGTGTQVGTPFYMSPEAWEGKPLDAQTDIWALGIMLYEMLSGQVPFSGDTVVAVMNKVLNAPLPPLSTLRPDVPPGLAQIVERMLTRDKAERYQSMREVGADLERGEPLTMVTEKRRSTAGKPQRALAKPTRAQPRPAPAPAGKPEAEPAKPRSPSPWLAAGLGALGLLALLALVGLGVGGWWLANHPALTPTPVNTGLPPVVAAPANSPSRCGPGETELFYDDFENGPAASWSFRDAAGQSAAAWPVVTDSTSSAGVNHVLQGIDHVWVDHPGGQDIALQLRVRRITGDGVAHINVRVSPGARHYVRLEAVGQLIRNPPAPPGQTLATFPLGQDTAWHTVRLAAAGPRLEVRFDGQVVARVDDADGPLAGNVALENTNGTMWYDDVLVCQLTAGALASPSTAPTAAQVSYPADRFGQALFLDGKTGYVEIPYSDSLNLDSALTLEGWVNLPRFPAQPCSWELCGLQVMLSQGHAGSSAGNYTLGLYDGGLVFAFETVDTKLVAPVNGLTNGWHHVAVTHRFGATQDSHWYLNGEELTGVRWTNDAGNPTDGAAPVKANSRSPYYLGFSATQHLYTAGALDEIRVWRVVRSQTDIQATMRQTLTGSEPGLVAYWNFDEPAGATAVRDLSPNGNTGQLRGGAQLRPPEAGSRPAAVVILEYPSGCSPNPVPAGLVVFQYGVGGGSRNLDEVQRAIGRDTYGAIFVNGKPVLPATSAMIDGRPLDANGRTVNPDCDGSQCGFTTFAALQLEPGTYDVSATWPRADTNPDPRSCRLTVSAP